MSGWRLSDHARARAREMHLPLADVVRIAEHASVRYAQPRYGEAAMIAKEGSYSVAYDNDAKLIITVLFNTQDRYQRTEAGA